VKLIFAIAAALAIFSGPTWAHQDRILQLQPNGSVNGIPSPYRAIRLSIEEIGTRNLKVVLTVGNRSTTLLPCATNLIRSASMSDVQISGSWYHDERTLPYYINVRFTDALRPSDRFGRSSLDSVFNLRTGELIDASRMGWKARDWRETTKPFAADCKVATTKIIGNGSQEHP
jgi:hypothetical protein